MVEDARPFSISKWKHQNTQFIHKTVLEQGVRQLAHAILQQTRARLLLELSDRLSNIPLYKCRVPLKRLLQASRRDIFGHTIYLVCHFPLASRPDLSKPFIGYPTYQ